MTAYLYSLPSSQALKKRLLDNQVEIGHELGKFPKVGASNGIAIGKLLTQHIVLADKVLQSAKASKPLDKPVGALYQQGTHLAKTLASVLHVKALDLVVEFHTHNSHVINLATLLLKGQTGKKYIKELDRYINHMLHLADIIYTAIVR